MGPILETGEEGVLFQKCLQRNKVYSIRKRAWPSPATLKLWEMATRRSHENKHMMQRSIAEKMSQVKQLVSSEDLHTFTCQL